MSEEGSESSNVGYLNKMWKQEIVANVDSVAIFNWWTRLNEQYAEANSRKYYNLEFLSNKASWFYKIKDQLKDPTAVACAIIFQYFDYEPQSEDWHQKNMEHFKQFATEVQIEDDQAQKTTELLEASITSCTEEHIKEGVFGSENIHYFLDLDMVNLGASSPEYRSYSDKMRQEYSFLRPDLYNKLRLKILQNFLQIPNIYATSFFREKFEQQARKNLSQEIAYLLDHPDTLGFKEDGLVGDDKD